MTGGAWGWSAVNGPCNKYYNGWSGSVASLEGSNAVSGLVFAHEMGHYLGLDHTYDAGNLMNAGGSGLYQWQGDVMKRHCNVTRL
jgi:Metallo-peptidase family M12B Reprolysin-like